MSTIRLTTSGRASAGRIALAAVLFFAATDSAARKQSFAEGRLWRVSKADVADSYVLGTIHIADLRVATLPRPVADAIARSRRLATELPLGRLTSAQLAEIEEFDGDQRLEPLIGTETFARLRLELGARAVPERVIERLRPWAAMMKVTYAMPDNGIRSIDELILRQAYVRRMRVTSLESVDEQAAAFDAMPLDSQIALLRHVLWRQDALRSAIEPTIDAWLRGDLAALAQITSRMQERFPDMGRHYAVLVKHIIGGRTAVMHYRLGMLLQRGRVFVSVGAAHLYGDDGLLAMLERDGYRISRIW